MAPTTPLLKADHAVNNLLSNITKLTDGNYADWKFDVVMVMHRAGGDLHRVTTGLVARLSLTDSKDLDMWNALSHEGLAIIGLSVDPSQKEFIRNADTAPEAWDILKDLHEKNNTSKRTALKRRFYSYHHDSTKSISTYISEITSAANALKAIGLTISTLDITDVLIYSLASEYGDVATALMTRSDRDTLSIADVSSALLEKEARMTIQSNGPPASQTFNTRTHNNGAACTICKKPGHPADRCWSTKTCDKCKKKGHISRFCTERSNYTDTFTF